MESNTQTKAEKLLIKGLDARDARRFKIARRWFLKAAQSRELPPRERAAAWVFAAECDEELGNIKEALISLRKAERYHPQSNRLQFFIGRMQGKLGRPKLAERAFRKAIALKPSADAYLFLAEALYDQERYSEEKECYRPALRLEPDNEEAHFYLGRCYLFERKLNRAEKHLRRAIEIDPKYAFAYVELGMVLLGKKQFRDSQTAFRRAAKLDPDHLWARLTLAELNWHFRRLKEAEKQYREALRIAPSDAYVNAVLGNFLYVEDRGDGQKYLKKALKLDPRDDDVQYYMGNFLCEEYRDEEAAYYLRKAARQGHKRAKKLLARLLKDMKK
jgi:tetratricopeptide (TPR) repeat protein